MAVKNLAKKYGIKREEVICIGDSLNDLAMIEYAGLGVVVENGSKEAKQAADIIAPSNDDEEWLYNRQIRFWSKEYDKRTIIKNKRKTIR